MTRLRPSTVLLVCLALMALLSWWWFFHYYRYQKKGRILVIPQLESTLLGQQVMPHIGPGGHDWRLGIQVKRIEPAGTPAMAIILPGPDDPGNPAVSVDRLKRWIPLWFMARLESGTETTLWETVGMARVGTAAHHAEMDLLRPADGQAMIGFRWQGRIYRAEMGNTAACLAEIAGLRTASPSELESQTR